MSRVPSVVASAAALRTAADALERMAGAGLSPAAAWDAARRALLRQADVLSGGGRASPPRPSTAPAEAPPAYVRPQSKALAGPLTPRRSRSRGRPLPRRRGSHRIEDPEALRATLDAGLASYDDVGDPAASLGDADVALALLRDPFVAPQVGRFIDGSVHLWDLLRFLGWPLERLWRAANVPDAGICVAEPGARPWRLRAALGIAAPMSDVAPARWHPARTGPAGARGRRGRR